VFCQLVYLRRCPPGRIRRALDELPETLDGTYARTLEEIDEQNWEYAHRLFQCVAAASRPLLVNELAEFLAFDFEAGTTPELLADWRPEDPEHTVLSMCFSLLAVVKPGDGSPVIQFAHFSVKEYLTSARLSKAKDTISRFQVSMTVAHTIVAQACLGALLQLDEDVTKESLEKFPLSKYAAEHWLVHTRFENVSSNVQDGMKRLFDPSKGHFTVWVWLWDIEDAWHPPELSERPEKTRATPLHYAAFCGMRDVAAFLIVEHSQDVNARGFEKEETPLQVASRQGQADVAQLLLEHGADIEVRAKIDESTPLVLASQEGRVEVARVLLKHGADTESRDLVKRTPLSLTPHVDIVRVLLEHGANVNSQDSCNRTPLHHAQGEEITRLLLEHGADANAPDIDGRTPLHCASEDGRVGVVRVLLEHGVDASAPDANDATPLHLASRPMYLQGHPDVVRLLLQYSPDIHARDDQGQTPFMVSTGEGNRIIMQLLLEHGAEDHRT
jgi:ankyrin repeat protein